MEGEDVETNVEEEENPDDIDADAMIKVCCGNRLFYFYGNE